MGEIMNENSHAGTEMKINSRPNRRKLGEILIEKKIITPLTVERVLRLCEKSGKRLGTILEDIGLVTGEELAHALALQYGFTIVSDFSRFSFPDSLLALIPVETAIEHTVFPLKLQNNTLALAMIDPTNDKLVQNIKQNKNLNIHPCITTRKEVNKAIGMHYLKRTVSEGTGNTIMIVDDDKIVISAVSNILKREGYEIVVATDGMEAFKEIICRRPDLIITDKEMPKINGYMLLSSLRNIPDTKSIPIILMSTSTSSDEESNAYDKGFFDYMSKPIRENILKAKIRRALRSSQNMFALHRY